MPAPTTLEEYMDDFGFDFNPKTQLWEVETFGADNIPRIIYCTPAQAEEHHQKGDIWK